MKAIGFKKSQFSIELLTEVLAEDGTCIVFKSFREEEAIDFAKKIADRQDWDFEWVENPYKHEIYIKGKKAYSDKFGININGTLLSEKMPW